MSNNVHDITLAYWLDAEQAWRKSSLWAAAHDLSTSKDPDLLKLLNDYNPKEEAYSLKDIVMVIVARWRDLFQPTFGGWSVLVFGKRKWCNIDVRYVPMPSPITGNKLQSKNNFGQESVPLRVFFGFNDGKYEPIRFPGGISYGDSDIDDNYKIKNADDEMVLDLANYFEARKTLSNKRTVTISYRRNTPVIDKDTKKTLYEEDGVTPQMPALTPHDKLMNMLEIGMDLHGLCVMAQARSMTDAKSKLDEKEKSELPSAKNYVSICGTEYFGELMATQQYGYLNLALNLPQTYPAPDPLVAEVTPNEVGARSEYNPDLVILDEDLAKTMNNILLSEARNKKKKAEAEAAAKQKTSSDNKQQQGQKKPGAKRPKLPTRFSVFTGYDENGQITYVPMTDARPWIGLSPRKWDVLGFADVTFGNVATSQHPKCKWKPVAAHIIMMEPTERQSFTEQKPVELNMALPSLENGARRSALLTNALSNISSHYLEGITTTSRMTFGSATISGVPQIAATPHNGKRSLAEMQYDAFTVGEDAAEGLEPAMKKTVPAFNIVYEDDID